MAGIAAARQRYDTAVDTAFTLWNSALAGDVPSAVDAERVIDALSGGLAKDAPALLALTTFPGRVSGDPTFTHMVNVAVLTLAQAMTLGLDGPLLRAFGVAALLHDIGKVQTPPEVLHKPERLTAEEFDIMKRHVVDGAAILRRTPGMSPLAAVVAFEHHLKQDLSGYPENVGPRRLNVCTMMVTIADVFDALRSHRPYRQGLATSRIRSIMSERDSAQFDRPLLMRFVSMMGLFPVGSVVRLQSGEVAVVTAERAQDPLRPEVRLVSNQQGAVVAEPIRVRTWEPDRDGRYPHEIRDAVDPGEIGIDPLNYL
ncbi:MAG: HD domain-containing phosphohydrolase [Vicinamibacterales bacterium]